MEADARAELPAHRPLLLDEGAQRGVVGIRHVLLETERRGDEVDRHASASHSASMMAVVSGVVRPGSSSMESSRRYFAAAGGGERGSRAAAVFLVAALHLLHRGPDVGRAAWRTRPRRAEPGGGDARRVFATRSGSTLARTQAAASAGTFVWASSGERSKVM
jgi:hypothetical protein